MCEKPTGSAHVWGGSPEHSGVPQHYEVVRVKRLDVAGHLLNPALKHGSRGIYQCTEAGLQSWNTSTLIHDPTIQLVECTGNVCAKSKV